MRSSSACELGRRLAALVGDPAQDRVAGALAQARAVDVDAAHPRLRGERDERAPRAARARARAARTAWRARRSSGPRASRRPARRAARPRRARPRATPGIGMNAAASRLPSVIVPVLSSSSTSTSPDASTARPDSASTLRRTRRSMPAMPIALSSAPIVVGISATSSAIERRRRRPSVPAKSANGRSATTTTRKISVSPASRMPERDLVRRLAPRRRPRRGRSCGPGTTGPGSCVISTTMRSDSTRVPPVTAERSPPASRMTGADSPVIADSSTDAMPSIDGAVAGDDLAGLDDDDVAAAQLAGRLLGAVGEPRRRRRAHRAQRRRLRLAAALGDRLGEVAEEDRQPQPDRDGERRTSRAGRPRRRSRGSSSSSGADLDDEHHRVADHVARVELAQRRRRADRSRSRESATLVVIGRSPRRARG